MHTHDIIIIGAGASGLIAARELACEGYDVLVLEGSKRIGGRAFTFRDDKFPDWTETGAEFIHGKQKETIRLLKEYKIKLTPAKGKIWQPRFGEENDHDKDLVKGHRRLLSKKLKAVKRDLSLKKFLNAHFKGNEFTLLRQTVQGMVEGYESADVKEFSTIAFRDEWHDVEKWKQYRVKGGYRKLMNALATDITENGGVIRFSSVVYKVRWKKHNVEVYCKDGKVHLARQAIITVPLGVLQAKRITFLPAMPGKSKAIQELGFGDVIKILLLFKTPFWQDKQLHERVEENLDKLFFLFSKENIPTWWTQSTGKSSLLTGWLSGPKAQRNSSKSNQQILQESILSLASIFKTDARYIRSKLKSWKVVNWCREEFTLGSYAYATVNGKKNRAQLTRSEKDTLFFAGEHLADEPGTVEAALKSGLKVARDIKGK